MQYVLIRTHILLGCVVPENASSKTPDEKTRSWKKDSEALQAAIRLARQHARSAQKAKLESEGMSNSDISKGSKVKKTPEKTRSSGGSIGKKGKNS